eukprot:scaffold244778_cov52-Prasinocladus_malaysianus.AAC.1
MKTLQTLLVEQPGVFGARFSGAGTRGACVAIVEPNRVKQAATEVLQKYRKAHSELSARCHAAICETGNAAWVGSMEQYGSKFGQPRQPAVK